MVLVRRPRVLPRQKTLSWHRGLTLGFRLLARVGLRTLKNSPYKLAQAALLVLNLMRAVLVRFAARVPILRHAGPLPLFLTQFILEWTIFPVCLNRRRVF